MHIVNLSCNILMSYVYYSKIKLLTLKLHMYVRNFQVNWLSVKSNWPWRTFQYQLSVLFLQEDFNIEEKVYRFGHGHISKVFIWIKGRHIYDLEAIYFLKVAKGFLRRSVHLLVTNIFNRWYSHIKIVLSISNLLWWFLKQSSKM